MYLFFLYFFINKYFFINIFNIARLIIGLFLNLFFLIEYIFLFVFNFYFFYSLILYKYIIKEKLISKKKLDESKIIKQKVHIIKKKKEKKNWIKSFITKFWYYYNIRWMYKGWFLFFVEMQRWKMRQFKYYLQYMYYYKVKLRFRNIKFRILGSFFAFSAYNNYHLIIFFSNLKWFLVNITFFLMSLRLYCIDFLKVKIFFIYNRFSFFIKTKQYNNILKRKKKK